MSASFDKHFILSASAFPVPAGWRSLSFGGCTLATAPALRHYPVTAADGRTVGWIIGWLIGPEGVRPDGESLPAPTDGAPYAEWSRAFCGRYFCVLSEPDGAFAYTDAGGLLPLVYAPAVRAAAAIPTLIREVFGHGEPDTEVAETIDLPRKRGWYPFGLTPLTGVTRLLPNFRLKLADFSAERYWPQHPLPLRRSAEPGAARQETAALFAIVERNAQPLTHGPSLVHLTGGYDSRMVLAACFERKHDLRLVTIFRAGGAELDRLLSTRLAQRFGLHHTVQSFIDPTSADVEDWLEKTGHCLYDHVTSLCRTQRQFGDTLQISGMAGEVGRAFYWEKADVAQADPPGGEDILKRLDFPATPRLRQAAEAWRATLPPMAAVPFWDLVYIEQRLGCWAGPSVYGSAQPVPSLTPFNSRAVYETMLRLPALYRCSGAFARDFIGARWPQLLRLPFNRAPGLARLRFLKAEAKALLPKLRALRA